MTNTADLTIFALRTAADALDILRTRRINPYAIAHLVDKTAKELRKPTDEELLEIADFVDQKLTEVFGPAEPAPGHEPNDSGPSHDEH